MKMKVILGIACISSTLSLTAVAEQNVYQVKSEFIEMMDKAATIHSRDASLRRNNLLAVTQNKNESARLSKSDELFLENLGKRFGVDENDGESLSLMTDKVPTSIIIAVAIKESNWGTDEVLSKANNLFGIRCFKLGCGVKDNKSEMTGVYSELMTFNNNVDATRAFAKNLNINSTFSDFRKARKEMRDKGEYLTSLPLAEHIKSYSGDEVGYGASIRKIIHENKLYYLDE